MPDETRACVDCNQPWTLTEGEKKFFASRNLHEPKRCKPCRQVKRQQNAGAQDQAPRA